MGGASFGYLDRRAWNSSNRADHNPTLVLCSLIGIMSGFATENQVYLVLGGKTGWIGGKLIDLLTEQKKTFYVADSRTYNRQDVEAEFDKYRPTHVLNAAGVTGRPNVDWCEDHKEETIRTNVIGMSSVPLLSLDTHIAFSY